MNLCKINTILSSLSRDTKRSLMRFEKNKQDEFEAIQKKKDEEYMEAFMAIYKKDCRGVLPQSARYNTNLFMLVRTHLMLA
jgi:hypothetical protein